MPISQNQCDEITRYRLDLWSKHLHDGVATPICLIGIGQGAESAGTPIVCIPEDLPNSYVAGFLFGIAKELMKK